MTELTKINLNNQIVSMRHNIKRAKVHIVHKLTRQIGVLRKKSVPDALKSKYEEKASRFAEEIIVLKSMPDDEAAVFSLLNPKDPLKSLADPKSNTKVRVLNRIFMHKSITPIVEIFRKKYPNWKETAPTVFIELKSKKKRKKLETEDKEKVPKDNETQGDNISKDSELSSERKADVEVSNKERNIDLDAVDEDMKKIDSKKIKLSLSAMDPQQKIKQVIKCKKKNEMFVETASDMAVDPFFMTDHNQFYVTNVKTKDRAELDRKWEAERKKNFYKQFKRDQLNELTQVQDQFLKRNNSILNLNESHSLKSTEADKRPKQARAAPNKVAENTAENQILHPSWQAKKQQQSIIPFAGKKITFD